jgi:hypothetical protein
MQQIDFFVALLHLRYNLSLHITPTKIGGYMVYLYDKGTDQLIGEIGEDELQFLIDQMEEESTKDQDYSITRMEIAYFSQIGASPHLINLLKQALGEQTEVIILWSREAR